MVNQRRSGGGQLQRPSSSGLADVVDIIPDKGLVIDAYVRVSLVGIELMGDGVHQAARGKTSGPLEGIKEVFTGGDDEDEERRRPAKKAPARRRRSQSG